MPDTTGVGCMCTLCRLFWFHVAVVHGQQFTKSHVGWGGRRGIHLRRSGSGEGQRGVTGSGACWGRGQLPTRPDVPLLSAPCIRRSAASLGGHRSSGTVLSSCRTVPVAWRTQCSAAHGRASGQPPSRRRCFVAAVGQRSGSVSTSGWARGHRTAVAGAVVSGGGQLSALPGAVDAAGPGVCVRTSVERRSAAGRSASAGGACGVWRPPGTAAAAVTAGSPRAPSRTPTTW